MTPDRYDLIAVIGLVLVVTGAAILGGWTGVAIVMIVVGLAGIVAGLRGQPMDDPARLTT